MSAQGIATVTFAYGAMEATAVVTGQTGLTATNLVEAWMPCNDVIGAVNDDSAWVEQMKATATKIVPGVGFTIIVKPAMGYGCGTYNVAWVWN